ncbi:MAG: nitrous oxide reductase family maturation protein NosD [Bacteroidetes bacterium]|nr:nitrous oxide reductase family maturation protein NosD [Bacteroidota bacterium]
MKPIIIRLIFFSILFSKSFTVFSKTIYAGKNQKIKSINQAISIATAYDSIIITEGKYFEKNIIINKPLVLIGKNFPLLDGEKKYEIVSIKSNEVIFTGFKLQNSGKATMTDPAAIKVYNSKKVIISGNIILNSYFGIYIQYGIDCKIKDNKIIAHGTDEQQIGNAIHCWKSDSLIISGNYTKGHRDGIYFEFVTNSVIWRNISKKNVRYGLHFMFSHNDSYISNVFENNGAGVAVMFTNNVKMYNNFFIYNWGDAAYGILLKEISDSYIVGNHFSSNTVGIYLEGVSRSVIEKNIFEKNGWALKIQASCMEANINFNNFIGNTFDVGTNGTLVMNNFNSNYWDKYEGYDLNRNGIGDVPYRPISLFSMIIEKNQPALILFRSIMVTLLDKSEKLIPSLTPENLKDEKPLTRKINL